jgi:hypothetical protein
MLLEETKNEYQNDCANDMEKTTLEFPAERALLCYWYDDVRTPTFTYTGSPNWVKFSKNDS